jgi:sugar/nucleoside kinase (ribokinase family)
MSNRRPVVCLGIMVADVLGKPLKAIPEPGRLVLVEEMSLHTGGCAVNTATALGKLGIPVEVIGKVGTDPFGDFLLDTLKKRNIGVRGVSKDKSIGTSATMVLIDPEGERRFIHYIGANAMLRFEDVDMELLRGNSILHIAGSLVLPGIDGEPTAELLRSARAEGLITFLDTVWDDKGRWIELMKPCLPHIDYFVPSLPEAQEITKMVDPYDVASALIDEGVGTVGLKMGGEGCLIMSRNGKKIRQPAYPVEVVDATGAGDAFAAGFIAGVWKGWKLEETATFANAVGAMCVTGLGASGGVGSMKETMDFINSTPKIKIEGE